MAEGRRLKGEHSGAKNGGGYWGRRAEAKQASRKKRRVSDRETANLDGRDARPETETER